MPTVAIYLSDEQYIGFKQMPEEQQEQIKAQLKNLILDEIKKEVKSDG